MAARFQLTSWINPRANDYNEPAPKSGFFVWVAIYSNYLSLSTYAFQGLMRDNLIDDKLKEVRFICAYGLCFLFLVIVPSD